MLDRPGKLHAPSELEVATYNLRLLIYFNDGSDVTLTYDAAILIGKTSPLQGTGKLYWSPLC